MLCIIIPFFKLTFFEATLQSLANQTDKRFKVYIGDDASPEDCRALLKQFQGQFDFLYQRFDSNLGGVSLIQHWERCISLSKDERWIMILGDDDVLGANVVEEFYNNVPNIEAISSNVVRFATLIIQNYEVSNEHIYSHPIKESFADFFYRKLLGLTRSSLSEYIFLKESYLKYGFKNYDLAWYSDDFAWLQFSENNPIYSINAALVKVRISPLSISGNGLLKRKKDKAKFDFYTELVENHFELFTRNQKIKILNSYEDSIFRNDVVHNKIISTLIKLYLLQMEYFRSIKLIKRFLKNKLA